MTITTHTAIGAAIGFNIGNPILGFVLGFMSHLLIDMVPHGDSFLSDEFRVQKKKKKAVKYSSIDSLLAIILAVFIFNLEHVTGTMAVSAAIAGSIMPDLLVGLYDATKSKYLKGMNKLHWFFHDYFIKKHGDVKLRYAIIGQAGFIAFLINLV